MKAAAPAKAATSSDSSDSEDEAPKKKSPAKAAHVKKASSSSDESSSDSESDKPAPKAKAAAKASPAKAAAAKKAASSSDSDSESSSDEAPAKAKPAESSSAEESSDDDEDVEMGDASAKTNGKRKADDESSAPAKKVKVADGSSAPAENGAGPSKTVFVGRLSWNVDNDWLSQEFAECGEVVSARVQMDRNTGKSRGFGYVTFATEEAAEAALKLDGKEIDGRPVHIDKSVEKDQNTVREKRANAFGDSPSAPSSVLFVGNLSFDATEDAVWEVFSEYGDIKSVRLPTDRESGRPKGFGYVEFTDIEVAKKAYAGLVGTEIAGRAIRLDYSQPRDDSGGRGGFGGRGGRGGFGGDRGGFGGRGRGRGGFNDRGGGRVRSSNIHNIKLQYTDIYTYRAVEAIVAVAVEVLVEVLAPVVSRASRAGRLRLIDHLYSAVLSHLIFSLCPSTFCLSYFCSIDRALRLQTVLLPIGRRDYVLSHPITVVQAIVPSPSKIRYRAFSGRILPVRSLSSPVCTN